MALKEAQVSVPTFSSALFYVLHLVRWLSSGSHEAFSSLLLAPGLERLFPQWSSLSHELGLPSSQPFWNEEANPVHLDT